MTSPPDRRWSRPLPAPSRPPAAGPPQHRTGYPPTSTSRWLSARCSSRPATTGSTTRRRSSTGCWPATSPSRIWTGTTTSPGICTSTAATPRTGQGGAEGYPSASPQCSAVIMPIDWGSARDQGATGCSLTSPATARSGSAPLPARTASRPPPTACEPAEPDNAEEKGHGTTEDARSARSSVDLSMSHSRIPTDTAIGPPAKVRHTGRPRSSAVRRGRPCPTAALRARVVRLPGRHRPARFLDSSRRLGSGAQSTKKPGVDRGPVARSPSCGARARHHPGRCPAGGHPDRRGHDRCGTSRPRPMARPVPRPSDYAPRLRARLKLEQPLMNDAHTRGWAREVERHRATLRRIEELLAQLGRTRS